MALGLPAQIWDMWFRAEGALRSLDLGDIRVPLDDVRAFLMARYESRFSIHPRKFEEVVGSVFGDLGYKTAVTTYSRDGGIDVILHGHNGERIGVQAKRYKHSITVEQIRSFAGALMIGGFVKGIFVTTSHYQSGVYALEQKIAKTCVSIELLDADAFFEALGVAQLTGPDPTSEVLDMLTSDSRLELHYIADFPRNSV